jgi:hypothetical protein
MAGPTNAQLIEQLSQAQGSVIKLEKRIVKLTDDLTAERDRATGHAQARQESEAEGARLAEELRATAASLKAYKGSATKAQRAATVLKKQISPEPRKAGAMRPAKSEEETAARAAALEAAFAADTSEIVFSDGQREIRELAPLTVTGDAWRLTPHGRVLNHEPLLEPGDCQRQEVVLRGIALLNEAGDQVGYHHLNEPVTIGRNQRVQLPHNSIRF